MALVSIGDSEPVVVEHWRLRPCDPAPVQTDTDRLELINKYFTECAEQGKRPLVTGAALAAGYSGVTEMRRAAIRNPTMRHALSRAFTAIASYYEEMIGVVSGTGPMFMLKNMPDFDDLSPVNSPAQQAFQERLVVEEHIHGVERPENAGSDLPPRMAYLKLIKGEIVSDTVEEVVLPARLTTKMHSAVDAVLEE